MSQRLRLPWDRDPNDKEANYRRPIPVYEKGRLLVKAAAAGAGLFFVINATRDRADIGAEFLIGIGGPLLLAGLLDVIWTQRGWLEHVFIESRPMQLGFHSLMAVVGAGMLVGGLVARAAP